MTITEIKAERIKLENDLQAAVAPLVDAFEAKTGIPALIRTRRIEVSALSDPHRRFLTRVYADLDWEAGL